MERVVQIIVGVIMIGVVVSAALDLGAGGPSVASVERPVAPYVTASGRPASISDFRGRYLWVDHAAAWCSYCEPQTRTIMALERRYGDRLTFVTVVTGTDEVMEPPTAETARAWAERFGLDPERVLARFGTDTLPYHVLYSPDGEVLFRDSGLYDRERIISVLRARTPVLDR